MAHQGEQKMLINSHSLYWGIVCNMSLFYPVKLVVIVKLLFIPALLWCLLLEPHTLDEINDADSQAQPGKASTHVER